jgi:hypothetical protein
MSKKILVPLISLLVVIIAGVLVWVFWPKDMGWKTYTNDNYGYEIQYPSNLLGITKEDCKINAIGEDGSLLSLIDDDAVQFAYEIYIPGNESFAMASVMGIIFEICRVDGDYRSLVSYAEPREGGDDSSIKIKIGKSNGILVPGVVGVYQRTDSYFLEDADNTTLILRFSYDPGASGDVPYLKNWREKFLFENQKNIFNQMLSTFKLINR